MSSSSSSQLTVKRMNSEVEELQSLYREKKDAIHARLLDFKKVMQWNDPEVFAELSFCLLTPQSSAKVCWAAVTALKERSLLLKGAASDLGPMPPSIWHQSADLGPFFPAISIADGRHVADGTHPQKPVFSRISSISQLGPYSQTWVSRYGDTGCPCMEHGNARAGL